MTGRALVMSLLFVQLLSGLANAMFLFLIASGLSLIFGVTRIVNFAHGSFYMLAAYLTYSLAAALPGGAGGLLRRPCCWPRVLVAVLGGLVEVLLLRRVYRAPELYQLLLTFALVLVIADAVRFSGARTTRPGPTRRAWPARCRSRASSFPTYDLALIAFGPLVALGLWWLFHRTRWGILIRAATQDREMVAALGVDQSRLFTVRVRAGLASWPASGGALQVPRLALTTVMDTTIIVEAFVVVVIGGMGSVLGRAARRRSSSACSTPSACSCCRRHRHRADLRGDGGGADRAAVGPARPARDPARAPPGGGGVAEAQPPAARPDLARRRAGRAGRPARRCCRPSGSRSLVEMLRLRALRGEPASADGRRAAWCRSATRPTSAWAPTAPRCSCSSAGLPMPAAFVARARWWPALAACVFGYFCVRLTSIYFAMLTLAFAQIVYAVVHQWYDVTGGDNGMLGVWPAPLAGHAAAATTTGRSRAAVVRPARCSRRRHRVALRPHAAGRARPRAPRGGGRREHPRAPVDRVRGGRLLRRASAAPSSCSSRAACSRLRRRADVGRAAGDGAAGRRRAFAGAPLIGAAVYKLLDTVVTRYTDTGSSCWARSCRCSCSPSRAGIAGHARRAALVSAVRRVPVLETRGLSQGLRGRARGRRRRTSRLPKGEIRALIGPNGAGKTTLLQHAHRPAPGRRGRRALQGRAAQRAAALRGLAARA